MAIFIEKPTLIKAVGNKPKEIKEYLGLINSFTSEVSIAKMKSPENSTESGQQAKFNEYTVVLTGTLQVTTN